MPQLVNLDALPYLDTMTDAANAAKLTEEHLKRLFEHVRKQLEANANAVIENTCRPLVERLRNAGASDEQIAKVNDWIDNRPRKNP